MPRWHRAARRSQTGLGAGAGFRSGKDPACRTEPKLEVLNFEPDSDHGRSVHAAGPGQPAVSRAASLARVHQGPRAPSAEGPGIGRGPLYGIGICVTHRLLWVTIFRPPW
jgi:hypothetical protein